MHIQTNDNNGSLRTTQSPVRAPRVTDYPIVELSLLIMPPASHGHHVRSIVVLLRVLVNENRVLPASDLRVVTCVVKTLEAWVAGVDRASDGAAGEDLGHHRVHALRGPILSHVRAAVSTGAAVSLRHRPAAGVVAVAADHVGNARLILGVREEILRLVRAAGLVHDAVLRDVLEGADGRAAVAGPDITPNGGVIPTVEQVLRR